MVKSKAGGDAMTPPQACKWCAGTGTVNRYNPETKTYQDYDCGFCAPEAPEIQDAAQKAIAGTPWLSDNFSESRAG